MFVNSSVLININITIGNAFYKRWRCCRNCHSQYLHHIWEVWTSTWGSAVILSWLATWFGSFCFSGNAPIPSSQRQGQLEFNICVLLHFMNVDRNYASRFRITYWAWHLIFLSYHSWEGGLDHMGDMAPGRLEEPLMVHWGFSLVIVSFSSLVWLHIIHFCF